MNRNQQLLINLVSQLEAALDAAKGIKDEYAKDGIDSLVNIDLGSLLNTHLHNVQDIFRNLDDAGMFTAGQID